MSSSNEYQPNLISYQFVAKYLWKNMRRAAVLFNPMLEGHGGMDHLTMKRGYPPEYRRSPEEWLEILLSLPNYDAGHVIAESIRNTFQNLRCVVWTRATGLCQQKDEHAEESQRPYYCLVFFSDSEVKVQPMKVRFVVKNGKPEPVTEAGSPLPENAHSLISGPAALWQGSICSGAQLAAGLSDFPHMFELKTSKARGAVAEDIATAKRLTEVARAYHLAPEDQAGGAVLSIASASKRERNYLHHGLGWAPDGLVSVIAHGRLEDVGALAARAGATHLLVVDNGGSPFLGLRSATGRFGTLVSSYYYRPEAIAMLMIELSPEDVVFDGRSDVAQMIAN